MTPSPLIALVGPPNSGKSSLFNRLTGARQKVANYPGVTVEKRLGELPLPGGRRATLLDLPGILELKPLGEEEWISSTVILGLREDLPPPHLIVVVLDGTTPERGFHLLFELKALGIPLVVALTRKDLFAEEGIRIRKDRLAKILGAPVVEVSARTGEGLETLKEVIGKVVSQAPEPPRANPATLAFLEQWRHQDPHFSQELKRWLPALASASPSPSPLALPTPEELARILKEVVERQGKPRLSQLSERVDRLLLHPVLGVGIFLLLMFLLFQSVYRLSEPLVDLLDQGRTLCASWLSRTLPPTLLLNFLTEGVLGGVGNVVSFLPQILILFFWIAILEESGYLARVAFLFDRPLRGTGMSGKSVVPLLSGFACAVPAIMATRTIEDLRARLITIFVIPLMTCSARLPVYTLLIGAFVPERKLLGIFNLQGLVMFSLYALGVMSALLIALLLKPLLRRRGIPIPMILELPLYQAPRLRNVGLVLWTRGLAFLRRAGTYIFLATLILWVLLQFPRNPEYEAVLRTQGAPEEVVARYRLEHSVAGRLGKALEPLLAPLGFDWKIGVGLIASFSAREVMVSTLGTIYSVGDPDAASANLREALRNDRRPDGTPVWDLATALSLLVFYVYALQCVSTVVIMTRELGSLLPPFLSLLGTYGLAYGMSFLTYHLARLLLS